MISARLLAATVALVPASVAGFDPTAGTESLDASPRRTYFGPNRHNRSLLAAFVAHHGRAEVASRADVTYLSCAQLIVREGRARREPDNPWNQRRSQATSTRRSDWL